MSLAEMPTPVSDTVISSPREARTARTVTVPPRTLPYLNSGSAFIGLNGRYAAWINVDPGGGADSVGYAAANVGTGPFRLAPRVGDRLAISIYYDQRGHIFFTVTDLTRPAEQTMVPQNTVVISGKEVGQVLRLMDMLEDHDDVQKVYSNFDISEKDLEEASR